MHFSHFYFYLYQLMRLHELVPEVRIQNSLETLKTSFENHFKTFYPQIFFFSKFAPKAANLEF